ncbi:MAG: hypothetical protein ACFFD7_02325 [Candidatus Thorarchaeota archaeon]
MTTKTQIQLRERIFGLMKREQSFLDACLLILFEQQTIEERQIKNSVYRNAVGFNRPDAYLLSDYSIWKLNFPNKKIRRELKTTLLNKLEKYSLQLSSYREIMEVLDGLKDPSSIVKRIKSEMDVDILDTSTPLEDFLIYKKLEREREQKVRTKKKGNEEMRNKLSLTHDAIKGSIIEISSQALKIRTSLKDYELDLWFPRFSIITDHKEELNIIQEFMINKRMLAYKIEDALDEYQGTNYRVE